MPCSRQVAPPTPLRENSCPRPPPAPEGVVISEVASSRWTNHSQQRAFVELHGRPMTDLRGLVLTVFDQERSGTRIALPLTGSIDQDGFYVIGNVTGAGESGGRSGFMTFSLSPHPFYCLKCAFLCGLSSLLSPA